MIHVFGGALFTILALALAGFSFLGLSLGFVPRLAKIGIVCGLGLALFWCFYTAQMYRQQKRS
jgi:hypothetical protein